MRRKARVLASAAALLGGLAGFPFPERMSIPVVGALGTDGNNRSFWHTGSGDSGVHKKIDPKRRRGAVLGIRKILLLQW